MRVTAASLRATGVRPTIAGAALARLVDGAKASTFAVLAVSLGQSATVIALLAVSASLPVVLLGPHIGVLIDRYSPRLTSIWALIVQTLTLAFATAMTLVGAPSVPTLIGLALVLGVCQAVTDNSLNALVPELVGRDELTSVNGTMTTFQTAARVVGPAAFGVLVIWSPLLTFLCWVVLSVAALLCVSQVHVGPKPAAPSARAAQFSVLEGLRWIAATPQIRTLLIGVTLANVSLGALTSVLPIFAVRGLGVSTSVYGMGSSAMAVAGIAGSFAASRAKRVSPRLALVSARAVQTVGMLVLAFSDRAAWFFVAMSVIGLASGTWNVVSSTFLMAEVPADVRGRVMASYRSIAFAGGPTGNAIGATTGASLARAGVVSAAVLSGVATFVVVRLRKQISIKEASCRA